MTIFLLGTVLLIDAADRSIRYHQHQPKKAKMKNDAERLWTFACDRQTKQIVLGALQWYDIRTGQKGGGFHDAISSYIVVIRPKRISHFTTYAITPLNKNHII